MIKSVNLVKRQQFTSFISLMKCMSIIYLYRPTAKKRKTQTARKCVKILLLHGTVMPLWKESVTDVKMHF